MKQPPLIGSRRFLPLLATQTLGAFNDNLFKNALVVLVLYRLAETPDMGQMLVTAAMGVFILPWLVFSGIAGAIADKVEKSGLTRWLKGAEIAIMGLGAVGLLLGNVTVLMIALFLMGSQSALLGPVKFAIIPEQVRRNDLVAGNAYIEAATYLAILGGTIAGGLLIMAPDGPLVVSVVALGLAAAGLGTSLFIPRGEAKRPGLVIPRNPLAASWQTVAATRPDPEMIRALLVIAWFHLLGATFLTQFPAYAKGVFRADAEVVTLFLTVFSIGVALGAALCKRLLRGEISARLAPMALIGVGLGAFDLVAASHAVPHPGTGVLIGAATFLQSAEHIRVLVDLLVISVSGGLLIVPLYALIQDRAPEDERARAIAASNILNALFIVLATAGSVGLLAIGLDPVDLFLIAAVLNLGAIVLAVRAWPEAVTRVGLKAIFTLVFRVRVTGLENLEAAPGNAVLVANHLSYVDGPILGAWLPGSPVFAVHKQVARKWWARPFMALIRRAEIEPGNPHALKTLIRAAQAGERCVIFPEGRLSVTGGLMKVYDGPAVVADAADVPVVPVRIAGTESSLFSKLGGTLRRRWFPKVTVTILPARRLDCLETLTGAARRRALGQALYDTMSALVFETAPAPTTLPESLRRAAKRAGSGTVAVRDATGTTLTYGRLRTATQALGARLARETAPGETVGVLLPTMAATLVTVFGLLERGRVPAMLNFSAGLGPVTQACTAARVDRVVTSRAFVEKANLSDLIAALSADRTILYLEDMKQGIGRGATLRAAWRARFGRPVQADPDDPAVVLFTSGSEGTPKGVVLSHANLLANCHQLQARIAFSAADTVFNPLPMFHAFGLTGGVLLPLLHGVPVFLYPSPLHYRAIPELVYQSNATILFGTDTFLSGYGKAANPYDLHTLRLVFAGAERVTPTTRALYADKFGLRILEGYGATECGPVIAVNTPMHHKPGTVGRLLPGLDARLEPVDGVAGGARLLVRGPNVMLGYLRVDRPGHLEAPACGWYDTGDIVARDADGFLTLLDRARRFAKVAGEMVSLGAVEQMAAARWPDARHAAIALPCPRKGEMIVLATTGPDVEAQGLREAARAQGRSELSVPARIVPLDALPILPSGKTDYRAVSRLLESDTLDAAA